MAAALFWLAPAAGAGSTTQTGTAPQQLTNAYPIGPQRLCCAGKSGSAAATATTGASQPAAGASQPAAGAPPRAAASSRPSGRSSGSTGQSGSSGVIWIGIGVAVALLLATCMAVMHRMNRRLARALSFTATAAHPIGTPKPARLLAGGRPDRGQPEVDASLQGHRREAAAATGPAELAYRRADRRGDGDGAFNLGVLLHERRDFVGAAAAYQRAEQRGDCDAAFNLGVLQYEAGDLDGAERAWRRSARGGNTRAEANLRFLDQHRPELEAAPRPDDAPQPTESEYRRADESGDAEGAFNLGVLLHRRRDFSGAAAAYRRAEQRGDRDAAFNLGVLLYDAGDLDGAEGAFRRSAQSGNARAKTNLRFLAERRGDLERAHH
jgi:Tfp pilus assembly protein PilF